MTHIRRVLFSVVVPARDDREGVLVALEGLCQQIRAPDEVLVVDAGRQGSVTDIIATFQRTLPLEMIRIGPAYPGRARNVGLRTARHPYIVFLDAGTNPCPEWLAAFEEAVTRQPDINVVYGTYLPRIKDDWDWAACAYYLAPGKPPAGGRYPTAASLLINKKAVTVPCSQREDLRAGEDLLLFAEFEQAQIPTVVAPGACVKWELPAGPLAHFRRLRLYSRSVIGSRLWKRWHRAVFIIDTVAIVLLAAGLLLHWSALVALLFLGAGRVFRNYRIRRKWIPGCLNLSRTTKIVGLAILADLATLVGAADFFICDLAGRLRAKQQLGIPGLDSFESKPSLESAAMTGHQNGHGTVPSTDLPTNGNE